MEHLKNAHATGDKCENCNIMFEASMKKRKCKVCSKDLFYCKDCSVTINNKIFGSLLSKGYCLGCFQKVNKTKMLPKTKDFMSKLKKQAIIKKKNPFDDYLIIKLLGQGAVGQVLEVQDKQTGEKFAIKAIKLAENFEKSRAVNEIGLMQLTSHPNIVKFWDAYEVENNVFLVLELMKDSVYSLIRRRIGINEQAIAFVCKEVLKGIQYLHSFGRVHRDIKSDNIMFNENGEIKIADFGFSAQLTVENTLRTTIVGTPAYMAPEFVNIDGYDGKVDIWAVGVLAYEMAEGRVPVNGRNNLEILTATSNSPSPTLSQPSNWSGDFNHFLLKCFSKNPDERPDAENLLIHPFLVHSTSDNFKLLIKSA